METLANRSPFFKGGAVLTLIPIVPKNVTPLIVKGTILISLWVLAMVLILLFFHGATRNWKDDE